MKITVFIISLFLDTILGENINGGSIWHAVTFFNGNVSVHA